MHVRSQFSTIDYLVRLRRQPLHHNGPLVQYALCVFSRVIFIN